MIYRLSNVPESVKKFKIVFANKTTGQVDEERVLAINVKQAKFKAKVIKRKKYKTGLMKFTTTVIRDEM